VKGFITFIRQQGVVGLAVGFILGGSVSRVVSSLVQDIINPFVGLIIGTKGDLENYVWTIGAAEVKWGSFAGNALDFVIIAFIIYYIVKGFRLDRLDKKKE
jgi:large conductance mechanosensitive channel